MLITCCVQHYHKIPLDILKILQKPENVIWLYNYLEYY